MGAARYHAARPPLGPGILLSTAVGIPYSLLERRGEGQGLLRSRRDFSEARGASEKFLLPSPKTERTSQKPGGLLRSLGRPAPSHFPPAPAAEAVAMAVRLSASHGESRAQVTPCAAGPAIWLEPPAVTVRLGRGGWQLAQHLPCPRRAAFEKGQSVLE